MTNQLAVENIPEDNISKIFDILKEAGVPDELDSNGTSVNKFIRGVNKHAVSFKVNKVIYTAHSTKELDHILFIPHPEGKIKIDFRDHGLTIFENSENNGCQGLDLRNTNEGYRKGKRPYYNVCNTTENIINKFIEKFKQNVDQASHDQ